jgi:hypothetical protein
MQSLNARIPRRHMLAVTATTAGVALAQVPATIPPPPPQLKLDLVKEFVGKSHGDFTVVRELARQEPMLVRASFDQGAGDWETGLGAASHMGRRDIARFPIDTGARIDAFAIFMLGEVAAAKALLSAFPAIHKVPGPHGIPLLSHAVMGRKEALDTFRLLLEAGADVNAAAWRGATPLMAAVAVDQPETVRALLDHGADAKAKTPEGLTAVDLAKKRGLTRMVEMLESGK